MSDHQSSSSFDQHVFDLGDAGSEYAIHTFERYNIERSLGSGAMATVLLATDKKLNRKVAIKVPLIKSEKNTEIIEKRFLREAQAAARLSHPNICPIHDVGLADGTYFISMAYIEGQSLSGLLHEKGDFEETEAAQLVRKIASGVAEAHRQGFVHRDLKPGNIMIDQRGEPIILDFGLARFFDNSQLNQTLTLTGQTVGTPAYMSPEQATGSRDLSPTSDIFSLGVILWEMLCGERPFTGDTMKMLNQIVNGPSPSPRTKRRDLSSEMEAICLKAIANKPEDRYQSMQEFEQALSDLLAGHKLEVPLREAGTRAKSSHAAVDSIHETRAESHAKQASGGPPPMWVWGVIGVLIVIIAGLLILPMFVPPEGSYQGSAGISHSGIDLSPDAVFAIADKDQNGELQPHELALHVIKRVDRNGDNALTLEELKNGHEELGLRMYDTPRDEPLPPEQIWQAISRGIPPLRSRPGGQRPPPGGSQR